MVAGHLHIAFSNISSLILDSNLYFVPSVVECDVMPKCSYYAIFMCINTLEIIYWLYKYKMHEASVKKWFSKCVGVCVCVCGNTM